MNTVLLIILIFLISAVIIWGFSKKERMYQFPFLIAVIFLIWFIPQAIGLVDEQSLPPGGYNKTILMAIFCATMAFAGYILTDGKTNVLNWKYDYKKLLFSAAILSLIGAVSFYQLNRLPEDLLAQTQWSGAAVKYHFFAQIMNYGLVLAAIIYLSTKSKIALSIFAFDILFYLDAIFIALRRAVIAELVLLILLSLWFYKKWIIPRYVMAFGVVAGFLFISNIGALRSTMNPDTAVGFKKLGEIENIRQIGETDFISNAKDIMDNGGAELKNAIYFISDADIRNDFNYGKFYWDQLIDRYYPGQIFGSESKIKLMFEPDRDKNSYDYRRKTGTTATGMTDSFKAFWYFGSLIFLLIGFLMKKIYSAAVEGNIFFQMFYILIIVDALHIVTHSTANFFMPWVHIVVFILPFLYYSRARLQD